MSGGGTCAGADGGQPAPTSEARYGLAVERTRRALTAAGEASAALKVARKARDSAVSKYGPASSDTERARVELRRAVARMRAAAAQLHHAEEQQDVALGEWARDTAAKHLQYRRAVVARPSHGGPPPEAGPPQCSEQQA
ncbi:MAG TPA: hypothetical protein VK539_03170 [Myxococcaceae bacterium]|nr:hypothetical protein [Myxococcaceae bacterium]